MWDHSAERYWESHCVGFFYTNNTIFQSLWSCNTDQMGQPQPAHPAHPVLPQRAGGPALPPRPPKGDSSRHPRPADRRQKQLPRFVLGVLVQVPLNSRFPDFLGRRVQIERGSGAECCAVRPPRAAHWDIPPAAGADPFPKPCRGARAERRHPARRRCRAPRSAPRLIPVSGASPVHRR